VTNTRSETFNKRKYYTTPTAESCIFENTLSKHRDKDFVEEFNYTTLSIVFLGCSNGRGHAYRMFIFWTGKFKFRLTSNISAADHVTSTKFCVFKEDHFLHRLLKSSSAMVRRSAATCRWSSHSGPTPWNPRGGGIFCAARKMRRLPGHAEACVARAARHATCVARPDAGCRATKDGRVPNNSRCVVARYTTRSRQRRAKSSPI